YGAGVVVIRSPIDVPFKSENEIADLPVEPELASPDKYAVVVSVAEVHAQEGVGHVTIGPGSPNVAAEIKSGPSERRGCICTRRRRLRDRTRPHLSGIRGHRRFPPR